MQNFIFSSPPPQPQAMGISQGNSIVANDIQAVGHAVCTISPSGP